jgi:proteasome lid subunit RPN8/RPN11
MKTETLDDIKRHALEAYPDESCGLVVNDMYYPCRNMATLPKQHFVLNPEDYATCEDKGAIELVVHSHPDTNSLPSDADKLGCENSGHPWMIVSVLKDCDEEVPRIGTINQFDPSGYKAPLVGRMFEHGVLDCYTLIQDWYKQELGIDLPHFDRVDKWWDDGASDLYTQNFAKCGFERIEAGCNLQVGDIILIQIRSKNNTPNHGAVYLGDGKMLHHPYGRLSCVDVYGGMWMQYTRFVVRRGEST